MRTSQKIQWADWTALGLSAAALSLSLFTACQNEGSPKIAPDEAQVSTHETARAEAPAATDKGAAAPAAGDEAADDEESAADEEGRGEETAAEEEKAADSSGLEIKRLVVTDEVKDREPAETGALEAGAGPVYAFVELVNKAAGEAGIVITFEHESGKKVGYVELDVPGDQSRWRTWGRTRMIREPGRWEAVVRGTDGRELGRQSFEVTQKG